MIVSPIVPITARAFAPYGWIAAGDDPGGRLINDGSSRRVDGAGRLALAAEGGAATLAVFRAEARDPRGAGRLRIRGAGRTGDAGLEGLRVRSLFGTDTSSSRID